jgi:hypothetical protein
VSRGVGRIGVSAWGRFSEDRLSPIGKLEKEHRTEATEATEGTEEEVIWG